MFNKNAQSSFVTPHLSIYIRLLLTMSWCIYIIIFIYLQDTEYIVNSENGIQ